MDAREPTEVAIAFYTATRMSSSSAAAASSPSLAGHLEWLFGRLNFERLAAGKYQIGDFELARMQRLLRELDDPHLKTPCVHVAGSKGKGSVVYLVDQMLIAAGHRVGRFTSPHREHYRERIALDGVPIDDARLAAAFSTVRPVVDALETDGCGATFFEVSTALGWVAFDQHGADVAVVEVGLGGRLDSTNLCRPWATAIVSISHDHGHLLGHGLDEIAREKAGILKPGVPTVMGDLPPEAASEVRQVAGRVASPVWQVGVDLLAEPRGEQKVEVTSPIGSSTAVQRLAGTHQRENLAVAVGLVHRLRPHLDIPDEAIARGTAAVEVPLRIEVVRNRPRVVLDVAHNGASVAALLSTLSPPAGRRFAIFGTSSDKHVDEMLQEMSGHFEHVYLSRYSSNPRALPVGDLAALAATHLDCETTVCDSVEVALARAERGLRDDDDLLIFGSFFLAIEAQAALQSDRSADDHATSDPVTANRRPAS